MELNMKEKNEKLNNTSKVKHFPEHGEILPNGKEVLLSLKNVDISFGKRGHALKVVKNASFDIYKGETFSLVGESGSGKTTIGRAVIRVNPLSNGEILYKGVRISGKIPHSLDREVIRNIQMVFQDPMTSLNPIITIGKQITSVIMKHQKCSIAEAKIRAIELMERVGIKDAANRFDDYPFQYSGGQRQRIGLARAIVMEPELIVADEPISALDVSIRAQVLNLLKKFQEERNLTYLFIAHDLSIVRFISDRIGVIYKGDIVEIASAEELFDFPLHPYTRSLISAIPIPDPELEKNKLLYTYDPSIHDYSVDKPELVDIGNGHLVYGNKKEIEEYKKIRESGITPKSITILDSNDPRLTEQHNEEIKVDKEEIMNQSPYDTGSMWFSILAFFLPIFGLIALPILKKHRFYKTFKSVRKGTIVGFSVIGISVLIFLIALLISLF